MESDRLDSQEQLQSEVHCLYGIIMNDSRSSAGRELFLITYHVLADPSEFMCMLALLD